MYDAEVGGRPDHPDAPDGQPHAPLLGEDAHSEAAQAGPGYADLSISGLRQLRSLRLREEIPGQPFGFFRSELRVIDRMKQAIPPDDRWGTRFQVEVTAAGADQLSKERFDVHRMQHRQDRSPV
jgi:hypothetical protein